MKAKQYTGEHDYHGNAYFSTKEIDLSDATPEELIRVLKSPTLGTSEEYAAYMELTRQLLYATDEELTFLRNTAGMGLITAGLFALYDEMSRRFANSHPLKS